jgi:hypothetical protein
MWTVDVGDIEHVIALERALLTPAVRRSTVQIAELLDAEFREIGASGRLWTRAEIMSALVEECADDDAEPIEAAGFGALVVADGLVVVSYVSDPGGRPARRTSLWRRSGTAWKLLHHQGTLLPRP